MSKTQREVTLYQLNFDYDDTPYIRKKTFKLDEKDKVKEYKNGGVELTLVDAIESGHNGDWSDDHENGYKTFKQAKDALIKRSKEDFKKEMAHIKSLKETHEDI
jgi:hypothetical protein